jgi:asparagine synthase (glutamine-hydrolysing)
MCGIAGFVVKSAAPRPDIHAMCDVIRHRGPDDEGFLEDGECAIGMRRLSIIDLSTGHQPISNEDGSVSVVFNGEIYNYQHIRNDLIASGHRFATNSDTETLVHLYEQSGTAGLERLRGMFAFAIWDNRRRRILLARDRFGKKPLYYAIRPEGLYFGSELKCLRASGIPLDPDPEALRLYLKFGYVPDPWSVYRGVRKLSPGGWLSYEVSGRIAEGRYWTLPVPASDPPAGLSEEEAAGRLRDLFDESVRLRMIADVPLGAFLSGGIDSSSVVASMALQSPEPIKTFSIGFEEEEFSELPLAEAVARQYKTDHHSIIVRPDTVGLVSRLAADFDEPFGDSSAIPTFIVSEFAARHVKVVLSGDGGDELFAGYDSFFLVDRLHRADRIPQVLRRCMAGLSERLPYATYGINRLRALSRPTALERYFEANYTPYLFARALLTPEWLLPSDGAFFRDRLANNLLPEGTDILLQAFYFEATANLTGDMLVKVDRMSMANSLEVRCPLLDHCLAELAARFPPSWKMRNGRGKQILLKALADRLPESLLNRPKKGFSIPLAHWFRGELKQFLCDHLLGSTFLQRGIVSPPFLRYIIEEHLRGRRNNHHWLWRLLMLELWFREQESFASRGCGSTKPVGNDAR